MVPHAFTPSQRWPRMACLAQSQLAGQDFSLLGVGPPAVLLIGDPLLRLRDLPLILLTFKKPQRGAVYLPAVPRDHDA